MKMKLWCCSTFPVRECLAVQWLNERQKSPKAPTWLSWRIVLGVLLWATTLTPSSAQSNLVNVGISPAISTNLTGSTIVLSATQDVQSVLFDYEWARNGVKLVDGDEISGAATPTLTITDAQLTNTGIYTLSLYLSSVLQARATSAVYVVQIHLGISPPISTNQAGASIVLSATQ